MRASKGSNNRRSNPPRSDRVLAVASQAAMGVSLGLAFALILTSTPFFGVLAFINRSTDPEATMATFVGTVVLMFGIGAALTGLVLMMEDE